MTKKNGDEKATARTVRVPAEVWAAAEKKAERANRDPALRPKPYDLIVTALRVAFDAEVPR